VEIQDAGKKLRKPSRCSQHLLSGTDFGFSCQQDKRELPISPVFYCTNRVCAERDMTTLDE
jgi:hypothetical protein